MSPATPAMGTYLAATSRPYSLGSSLNRFPFGEVSGPIAYLGEYQQIYLSTAFSGPAFINQIAFESAALGTLSDTLPSA